MPDARIVQRRRNRQTGTVIEVRWDDEAQWDVICFDHGRLTGAPTQEQALWLATVPADWCDGCAKIDREKHGDA
jgi:hypothetical protein